MAVSSASWLELMRREYLGRFVPGGGSATKFVLGKDAELEDVRSHLQATAEERRLHFVSIDAGTTKIHMIQDAFFAVARSVDWEMLAQRWLEAIFRRHHYTWPEAAAAVPLRTLAAANDIDEVLFRREIQKWLTQHIMRDRELAQDFRAAMANLCLRRMEMADDRAVAPVIEWLRGELRTIGPVRQVPISAKVTRHNGRAMLRSLCRWLRLSGGAGLLIAIDLRQVTRNASDGAIRYSPAAVLDLYEVLRQLIDDGENTEGLFVVGLADPAFADDDSKRSVGAYRALKERIWPDVHARGHENPVAPMVRVELGSETPMVAIGSGELPISSSPMATAASPACSARW